MKSFNLKLHYYLFILLAFTIPVFSKIIPIIIALIVLTWLLEFNFKEKFRRIKNSIHRIYILSFGILYLLYIIGTIYSSQLKGNEEGAFFDLEVKLSLLVFPLLLSTINFNSFKKDFFIKLLKAFLLGCLLSILFLFNYAVFNYFSFNDPAFLYYTKLSQWHHPSYLALYLTFSVAIILVKLIVDNPVSKAKWLFGVIMILLFQVFIVLLSSKAGIIGLSLTYIMAILYSLFKGKMIILRSLAISLSLLLALTITLACFPLSFNRFYSAKQEVESAKEIKVTSKGGTAARILIWNSSIEIIKENFLTGVGTGDVKHILMEKYRELDIKIAIESRLNAHNQYLQTFIAIGVIGFMVLLASILLPVVFSFRQNNMLYFLFLVMITFHFLVESMLERQAGVVFYAFINSFLFYFTLWRKS